MQIRTVLSLLATPVLALSFSPIQADTGFQPPQDDQPWQGEWLASVDGERLWLNPMVVTPSLTERTVDDTLASVSVIDRESIRRQQPREFSELLRSRPGVDVVSNGPFGKATSVFLRGTSNNQSMLLIDGIRMGSATTGGPSWQFLPPQLIDRAEILRGPRSSVYGADAIGGVVQVFTPEGRGEPSPWVEAGGGSFGSLQLGAGFQGKTGNTAWSVGANHFETDGIALREGGERKGYDNTSGLGRIRHEFDNGMALGFTGLRSQGRTEFLNGRTDFVHQAAGGTFDLPVGANWASQLSASQSLDEGDTLNDDGSESQFDTERRMVRWQNTLHAGLHEFVFGLDHLDDRIDSSTEYAENSRTNTGGFAQALLDFAPVSLELGLRYDDNEAYGSETTGSLGLGYRFDAAHQARLTLGEGFRAPTFNELYFPGFGNPDLAPEESRTAELGLAGHHDHWFWDAVAYQTDVDNLIETVFSGGVFLPQNVAEARIRGVELGGGAEVGQWTFYTAATYSDPEDRETGNRLRRRARESLRLEADRSIGDWSLGGTLIAQGKRFNDADMTERLGGFGLLNLRAGWHFAESWSARLTVDNVLDKDYVTARDSFNDFDYQQPGRSYYLTIRYGRN